MVPNCNERGQHQRLGRRWPELRINAPGIGSILRVILCDLLSATPTGPEEGYIPNASRKRDDRSAMSKESVGTSCPSDLGAERLVLMGSN